MKMFVVQLACGCCDETLQFENEADIEKAFREAGITTCATITDHSGRTVHEIDTATRWRVVAEACRERKYRHLSLIIGSRQEVP